MKRKELVKFDYYESVIVDYDGTNREYGNIYRVVYNLKAMGYIFTIERLGEKQLKITRVKHPIESVIKTKRKRTGYIRQLKSHAEIVEMCVSKPYLTQSDIAREIGCSPQHVSNAISRYRQKPKSDIILSSSI